MKYQSNKDSDLFSFLLSSLRECSKTKIRKWLKSGRICVENQKITNPNHPIKKGQWVTLNKKEEKLIGKLKVVYQDKEVIVINKPYGLLSVASKDPKEPNVHAILKHFFRPKRVYVVHRLDKNTSGLIVFALSLKSLEDLKKQLKDHLIQRTYIAIVEGEVKKQRGSWESYLYEDSQYRVHSSHNKKKGKKAVTHYQVVAKNKNYTKLLIHLETGKKNQIRVHCQEAGFPILGDKKYGSQTKWTKRLYLHAHKLSFNSSCKKKEMSFISPIPGCFKQYFPLS